MPKIIVGVMGVGEQATATEIKTAYELGQQLAAAGWVVLSGGRNVGVMEAVSQGAKSRGGLTIGILPFQNSEMSSAIDIPIITDMGNARNNINVLSSQVIVACGIGTGTVSEIALALKAKKPVILLSENPLAEQFFKQLAPDLIRTAQTVDSALTHIKVILAAQK